MYGFEITELATSDDLASCFGYQRKDGQLVPDPVEAPIRRHMYELFLEQRRKKTVARLMNEAGYRTRNGSNWSYTSVGRLLKDPTAKGLRRCNYTKNMGADKTWAYNPEEEWVYHEVEPIVSEELWNQCNHILEQQAANRKPPARRPVQLFSGLTYCHCGGKMYVPTDSPKYICQKCRNKIPVVDLDAIFHEQLRDFLLSEDELEAYLSKGHDQVKEKQDQIDILTNESHKIRREMDQVYDIYIGGKISPDGFGERYKPLESRLTQINDQLPLIQAELDVLKINLLSSDQIVEDTRDLYDRWPKLEKDDKRHIVEAITESIVIETDSIAINLCYLPTQTTESQSLTPTHLPEIAATREHILIDAVLWPMQVDQVDELDHGCCIQWTSPSMASHTNIANCRPGDAWPERGHSNRNGRPRLGQGWVKTAI